MPPKRTACWSSTTGAFTGLLTSADGWPEGDREKLAERNGGAILPRSRRHGKSAAGLQPSRRPVRLAHPDADGYPCTRPVPAPPASAGPVDANVPMRGIMSKQSLVVLL